MFDSTLARILVINPVFSIGISILVLMAAISYIILHGVAVHIIV